MVAAAGSATAGVKVERASFFAPNRSNLNLFYDLNVGRMMLHEAVVNPDSKACALDATGLLIGLLKQQIADSFAATLEQAAPAHAESVGGLAELSLRTIAASDALYHDTEHTTQVTLVGLAMLEGRQRLDGDVTLAEWVNAVVAMLCHDIGFVRGLLAEDSATCVATGIDDATVEIGMGHTDARLMPLHVDRGKTFVARYLPLARLETAGLDVARVQANIERTRFPVPDDSGHAACDDFPGLVRAADLIGQLSDRRYLFKLPAVYFELQENGESDRQGYRVPGDLLAGYPDFYRRQVAPWVGPGLGYLEQTMAGRQVVAQLYANLKGAEQGRDSLMQGLLGAGLPACR